MRAVLDANICLRGLFRPGSASGRILELLRNRQFTAVVSEPILAELEDVLSRPKIRHKYALTPTAANEFLDLLRERAEFVEISGTLHLCRDPDDDMLIETALVGNAEVVVTGDNDLLSLTHPDVRFVTAVEFLRLLDPSA